MERRNILIAAGSAVVAAIAAACGSSKSVSTTTTTSDRLTTTTRVTTPKHRHKTSTTTSSTTTSTTKPETSTTTTSPTSTTAPETTTTAPFPGWPAITRASSIPVGGTLAFTFGAGSAHAGQPGILYQQSAGTFVALDTICTHLNIVPCDLEGNKLVCPRHGSEFALSTGAVINGPAVQPLARAIVAVRPDGFVWFEGDA